MTIDLPLTLTLAICEWASFSRLAIAGQNIIQSLDQRLSLDSCLCLVSGNYFDVDLILIQIQIIFFSNIHLDYLSNLIFVFHSHVMGGIPRPSRGKVG